MAKSAKQDKKLMKAQHSFEPEAMAKRFKAPIGVVRAVCESEGRSVAKIESKLREMNYRDGTEIGIPVGEGS